MINAIAIDDEPLALSIIQDHASKIPYLDVNKQFTSALDALEYLRNHTVDLIFLDINMPDISGIEFLKSMNVSPEIIMTTAYAEYALECYDLNVTDYLLKPFEFKRFLKAVNKVASNNSNEPQSYLFVKSGYEHIRIDLEKLRYIKAEGNYVGFITDETSTLTRMKFKEAEELLPKNNFIKVHRSFVINKKYISKVERHQVHISEEIIPLSLTYYNELISNL